MLKKTHQYLMLLSVFWSLSACGVLLPEQRQVVLTKVQKTERPILIDTSCPKRPLPPPRPTDTNTLSKPAAEFFASLLAWGDTCADLNEAIDAVLRPSTEATSP